VKSYYQQIKPYWDLEISSAKKSASTGDREEEFKHLEQAHILGQNSTLLHTRTHILMLLWGIRLRNTQEVAGQIFRVFGALTKTIFGLIPSGNTGGSNVSPFKKMPVSPELQAIISTARST
jgi:hypothetical protein